MKAGALSNSIVFNLSADMPLMLEYQLFKKTAFFRIYIAPKIGETSENTSAEEEI
jgi:hypothetical protein